MALESLAVSKQIQSPAIVKLPFGLGVSDPPFCDLPLFFVPDVKLVPQTIDFGVGW